MLSPVFVRAQSLPQKPELLGFSSERLGLLHAAMQRETDDKKPTTKGCPESLRSSCGTAKSWKSGPTA